MTTNLSRRNLLLGSAAGVTALAVGASGPAVAAPRNEFRRDIEAILALGVTGVEARIVTPGRRLVVAGGVGDLDTGRPMPRDGRFRIASVRKTFLAVVALQLVAERRLRLDDPVERWRPGLVAGRPITLRHLLQNTSGVHDDLPGYSNAEEYLAQRYEVYTREELIARAMRHPLDFPPGSGWGYSNTGFLIAAEVIERVTGRSLRREVRDRIVRPLGLHQTSWPGTSPHLPRPHAHAYERFGPGQLVDVTEQILPDPDSMISTTRDLGRFFRALLAGRLLPPRELAVMRDTVPVNAQVGRIWPGGRYGLGLARRPIPGGGIRWGHDGGDGAFITVTGVSEDGRRSAVVSIPTAFSDSADDFVAMQWAADALVNRALTSG